MYLGYSKIKAFTKPIKSTALGLQQFTLLLAIQ